MVFLALEERPNSFVPIDLRLLPELNVTFDYRCSSLEMIDLITKNYTKVELKKMLRKANIFSEEVVDSPFVILEINDDKKHKYRVFDKEMCETYKTDEMLEIMFETYDTRNKIINKLNLMDISFDIKEILINAVKDNNMSLFYELYCSLDYLNQRKLYFFLSNETEFDIIKKRKLEKQESER